MMKVAGLYFRREHFVRITIIVILVFAVFYWVIWPWFPKQSKMAKGPVLEDFEPKIAEHLKYDFSAHTGSLKLEKRQFLLDNKPFTIISGAMHYFRVPRFYWKDRMLKMKAFGLNTLETYVAWNVHEEVKGRFDFADNLDLRAYIQLAHEQDLKVILRPGPYICAEWDLGGLPSWLLHDPKMKLRSNYKPYQDAVTNYFSKLIPKIQDLQYSKGGPIIMVQVENEFGSFSDEVAHLEFLAQLMQKHGIVETLVVSEGTRGLKKAPFNKALLTANFQKRAEAELMFEAIRATGSDVPLMVMEFWSGWFDHWAQPHSVVGPERISQTVKFILEQKSSINFYMFHGGTNFGFMAGANYLKEFKPDVTSYDYGAPVSEAGDLTRKYSIISELVLKQVLKPAGISKLPNPPPNTLKAAYGSTRVDSFLSWKNILASVTPFKSQNIVPMEALDMNNGGGQGYGYIVYRKQLENSGIVKVSGTVHDWGQVLLNSQEVTTLDWIHTDQSAILPVVQQPSILDLVIENMGRINFVEYKSPILSEQRKGLVKDVFLSKKKLENWEIYPLEFKESFLVSVQASKEWKPFVAQKGSPCLYQAQLDITDSPRDTFLNMKGWRKGVVFINGFNLGRYWERGPQRSLYVPAPVLKKGKNEILVFEQQNPSKELIFQDSPILG